MSATSLPPRGGPRSNQNFEPPFEWVRRDDRDTLLLDVSGFKKEQLKVQVNSQGNLKVSGERYIYGNQLIRFVRNFQVSKDCIIGDIRAKFQNGLLYVIMPKFIAISPQPSPPTTIAATTTASIEDKKTKKSQSGDGEPSIKADLGEDPREREEQNERRSTEDRDGRRYEDASNSNGDWDLSKKKFTFEPRRAQGDTEEVRQLIANTLVAMLVLVGLWVYLTYGLGSLHVGKHEVAA